MAKKKAAGKRGKAKKMKPAKARKAKKVVKKAAKRLARRSAGRAKAAARKTARKAKPVKKAKRPAKPAPKAKAKSQPKRQAKPQSKPQAKATPRLERTRRRLPDVERAGEERRDERMLAAARSGGEDMAAKLKKHTETSPKLTAGDPDAKWEDAYAVGDEAPGGDNPTPDQDRVDDIGKALGVQYQDDQELQGGDEIGERDAKRWELDPASSDDWPHDKDKD
jgi:hypothetical protein